MKMLPIRYVTLTAVFSLTVFTACSPSAMVQGIASPDHDTRARHYIQMLAEGQHDSILAHTPERGRSAAQAGLAQVDPLISHQRLDSVQLVNTNKTQFSNGRIITALTYEAKKDSGWIVIGISTVDSADVWFIEGMSVHPLEGELSRLGEFSLKGRSITHYLFLLGTLLCCITSIGTALFLATRRDFKKRWRWVFCSFIGVFAFNLNWATGAFNFSPLKLQLFGAGIMRNSLYMPWVVTAALPLGAALALYRYSHARAEAKQLAEAPSN